MPKIKMNHLTQLAGDSIRGDEPSFDVRRLCWGEMVGWLSTWFGVYGYGKYHIVLSITPLVVDYLGRIR